MPDIAERHVRLPIVTVDRPNTKLYAYGAPRLKGDGVLRPHRDGLMLQPLQPSNHISQGLPLEDFRGDHI
jgi:hypothetical protein